MNHLFCRVILLSLLLITNSKSILATGVDEEVNVSDENQCTENTIKLHNGIEMPILSLGTAGRGSFFPDKNKNMPFTGMIPEAAFRQTELALQNGIRSFDTALIYRSQPGIGQVIGNWFASGKLSSRSEIFITSKVFHFPNPLWGLESDHAVNLNELSPDEVDALMRKHIEKCLSDLRLGYIDLMLMHWPGILDKDADVSLSRQRRLAVWKVFEEYYNKGWLRAIGVSNFSEKHIQQLMDDGANIMPMVNQIEASPYIQYPNIVKFCQSNNIVIQSFSPFGFGEKNIRNDETILNIASKYNKDAGQIALRYLIQLGFSVTYMTHNPERMISNENVFDFELTSDEMEKLNTLNSPDGTWGLPSPHDII